VIAVDTSAIAAIFLGERDASNYRSALLAADYSLLSAASYLELSVVLTSRSKPRIDVGNEIDALLGETGIRIEPVTTEQVRTARAAFLEFGKGSGHPAQLNFGDCFSYALAKRLNVPLLFKGEDFSHTDITSALAP
jgi:ribonuclease VapC